MSFLFLLLAPLNFCLGFYLAMSLGKGPETFAEVKGFLRPVEPDSHEENEEAEDGDEAGS